ncbi:MAG: hypothetical protein H0W61_02685 [Bacteroidetes bacterium]|nr:hypothetical protein [Bacteroidota bacterium]
MEVNPTLTWLFEKYQENPNASWDISECFNSEISHPSHHIHALGNYLVQKGFVRNPTHLDTGGFTCSITTHGIVQVSDVLNEVKYLILEAAIEQDRFSVMDILDVDPNHLKRAHDYTNYLKRTGIIECIFHKDDILATPTFYGREWYNANKRTYAN